MTTPHGFWGEQETASWSWVNRHFRRLLPTQRATSPHVSVAWHVLAPVPQDHSPDVLPGTAPQDIGSKSHRLFSRLPYSS